MTEQEIAEASAEHRAGHDMFVGDALREHLAAIEAQPLADRAPGFEQLHDELLAALQHADLQHTDAQRAHTRPSDAGSSKLRGAA